VAELTSEPSSRPSIRRPGTTLRRVLIRDDADRDAIASAGCATASSPSAHQEEQQHHDDEDRDDDDRYPNRDGEHDPSPFSGG
jgi:hypothetical protein